ncbi:TPA: hypothetical protein ACOVFI_004304 [Citrobacter braakii]
MMEEYQFKGLDNDDDILGGVVIFLVICIITVITFIVFHVHIKTLATAVFFIVLNGFVGVTFFLLLIARSLSKYWLIKMNERRMEIYHNGFIKEKVNLECINSVMLAISNKRRYLKIIDDGNKSVVIQIQIQIYPCMNRNELNRFDDFSSVLLMYLEPFLAREESTGQGYLITNLYKNK